MIVTILYPTAGMTRFDEAYYAGTHIPLLKTLWGDLIEYVEMISFPPAEGAETPYRMITVVSFPDGAALGQAMAHPRLAELQDDVAVFTDSKTQALVGQRAGASPA